MQLSLLNLDLKNTQLKRRVRRSSPEAVQQFAEDLRLSWVFHDHALEGVVLSEVDLRNGVANEVGKDFCEQVMLDGIHRLYDAIGEVRSSATSHRRLDLNSFKQMHVLCASATDPNAGHYRKQEGPLGSYLQEAASAKTISYRLRKLVEFIDEEADEYHPVQAAAHVHWHYMSIFPFDKLSGRAGRLAMNLTLQAAGYPPAIIPASARADYFEALCSDSPAKLMGLMVEALETAIDEGMRTLVREQKTAEAA
ncbi:MAG: hypothetical protein AUK47_16640 [Deltaproteobacteria bacterium CG2_30_63_29]|nr:MAG: hypothetical protein AUK47_16640 [Deltaproteobacteria bacterium CG2_30_63_29]PJB41967.1 MAG: hypothetical protein CO108_12385 [Deltaproteobacteria bacterium CG_4_9_14_3_um_filter_63_12]